MRVFKGFPVRACAGPHGYVGSLGACPPFRAGGGLGSVRVLMIPLPGRQSSESPKDSEKNGGRPRLGKCVSPVPPGDKSDLQTTRRGMVECRTSAGIAFAPHPSRKPPPCSPLTARPIPELAPASPAMGTVGKVRQRKRTVYFEDLFFPANAEKITLSALALRRQTAISAFRQGSRSCRPGLAPGGKHRRKRGKRCLDRRVCQRSPSSYGSIGQGPRAGCANPFRESGGTPPVPPLCPGLLTGTPAATEGFREGRQRRPPVSRSGPVRRPDHNAGGDQAATRTEANGGNGDPAARRADGSRHQTRQSAKSRRPDPAETS
jgi:hypothetical protein